MTKDGHNPDMGPAEDLLQAYVDNLLDAKDRVRIETWLAHNPDAASRVRNFRAQNRALKILYADTDTPPLPTGILVRAQELNAAISSANNRRIWMTGLAAAAAFILGIGMLWAIQSFHLTGPTNTVAVIDPENASIIPIAEGGAQNGLAATSYALPLPDLAAMGFRLTNSRLFSTKQGLSAHILYEDGQNRLLALCIATAGPLKAANAVSDGANSLAVSSWQDGALNFTMAGVLPVGELRLISQYTADQASGSYPEENIKAQSTIPDMCREMADWLPAATEVAPEPGMQTIDINVDAIKDELK